MHRKLQPISQIDIEIEQEDLFKHGDMKPVAAESGQHISTFSRRINSDEPAKSALFEILSELRAEAIHNPEIGRAVFSILYRHAIEWELVDTQPVDVLDAAILRVRSIKRGEIRLEQEDTVLARIAVLGLATESLSKQLVEKRNNGNGRKPQETD